MTAISAASEKRRCDYAGRRCERGISSFGEPRTLAKANRFGKMTVSLLKSSKRLNAIRMPI
jgi:hypothetical protein